MHIGADRPLVLPKHDNKWSKKIANLS
ncbi:hypothetical protein EMIT0158MI4_20131 [Burkholderia ambifaria]